jgi:hypothetical protein
MGRSKKLTHEMEAEIRTAMEKGRAPAYNIERASWDRIAIAELIKQKFGIDISPRTVGDYMDRWEDLDNQALGQVIPIRKRRFPATLGRPEKDIEAPFLFVVDQLLLLTGLTIDELYTKLDAGSDIGSLLGKRATFYKTLEKKSLTAIAGRRRNGDGWLSRFELRVRAVLLPARDIRGKAARHICILMGFETVTGFLNCQLLDIRIPAIPSPDAARVCLSPDKEMPGLSYDLLADFWKSCYKHCGLPITKFILTQNLLRPGDTLAGLQEALNARVALRVKASALNLGSNPAPLAIPVEALLCEAPSRRSMPEKLSSGLSLEAIRLDLKKHVDAYNARAVPSKREKLLAGLTELMRQQKSTSKWLSDPEPTEDVKLLRHFFGGCTPRLGKLAQVSSRSILVQEEIMSAAHP